MKMRLHRPEDKSTGGIVAIGFGKEDGFIADWLKEHYGIQTLVPDSVATRQELNRIMTWIWRGVWSAFLFQWLTRRIRYTCETRCHAIQWT